MHRVTGSESSSADWRCECGGGHDQKPGPEPATGPYWRRRRLRSARVNKEPLEVEARQIEAIEHDALPGLDDAKRRVSRSGGLRMQSPAISRQKNTKTPALSAASFTLSPASFTASPAFSAASWIPSASAFGRTFPVTTDRTRERERRDGGAALRARDHRDGSVGGWTPAPHETEQQRNNEDDQEQAGEPARCSRLCQATPPKPSTPPTLRPRTPMPGTTLPSLLCWPQVEQATSQPPARCRASGI